MHGSHFLLLLALSLCASPPSHTPPPPPRLCLLSPVSSPHPPPASHSVPSLSVCLPLCVCGSPALRLLALLTLFLSLLSLFALMYVTNSVDLGYDQQLHPPPPPPPTSQSCTHTLPLFSVAPANIPISGVQRPGRVPRLVNRRPRVPFHCTSPYSLRVVYSTGHSLTLPLTSHVVYGTGH